MNNYFIKPVKGEPVNHHITVWLEGPEFLPHFFAWNLSSIKCLSSYWRQWRNSRGMNNVLKYSPRNPLTQIYLWLSLNHKTFIVRQIAATPQCPNAFIPQCMISQSSLCAIYYVITALSFLSDGWGIRQRRTVDCFFLLYSDCIIIPYLLLSSCSMHCHELSKTLNNYAHICLTRHNSACQIIWAMPEWGDSSSDP